MEREVWHIFYLKITSLIAIVTFLIVTSYLAITFGNYYAIYETPYSVKLELHEVHRQYWSQYIYICYLGSLLACDLIACLAILYNLNYIILFDIFHHLTLLLVKVYSGFELNIPGEHSEGVLVLYAVLHIVIIVTLGLLYKKLDSIMVLRQILTKEFNEKEQEKRRLSRRDKLNDRLLDEYQRKFVTGSSARPDDQRTSSRRESTRTVELEPVDIEQDFDTIKQKLKNQQQFRNNQNKQYNQSTGHRSANKQPNTNGKNRLQEDYDSDGYLKVKAINSANRTNGYSQPVELIKNQLTNSEDRILDSLNAKNEVLKYSTKSYSFDDESDDVYLEPDDAYVDNDYDYLKCNIDEDYYAELQPRNPPINSQIVQPTDARKQLDYPRLDQASVKNRFFKTDPNNTRKSADKSVQTNQSNSSNETDVFYTAKDTVDSNFNTNTAAIKESNQQYNNSKSRKVEYSTLKYDHKVFYESSV